MTSRLEAINILKNLILESEVRTNCDSDAVINLKHAYKVHAILLGIIK